MYELLTNFLLSMYFLYYFLFLIMFLLEIDIFFIRSIVPFDRTIAFEIQYSHRQHFWCRCIWRIIKRNCSDNVFEIVVHVYILLEIPFNLNALLPWWLNKKAIIYFNNFVSILHGVLAQCILHMHNLLQMFLIKKIRSPWDKRLSSFHCNRSDKQSLITTI